MWSSRSGVAINGVQKGNAVDQAFCAQYEHIPGVSTILVSTNVLKKKNCLWLIDMPTYWETFDKMHIFRYKLLFKKTHMIILKWMVRQETKVTVSLSGNNSIESFSQDVSNYHRVNWRPQWTAHKPTIITSTLDTRDNHVTKRHANPWKTEGTYIFYTGKHNSYIEPNNAAVQLQATIARPTYRTQVGISQPQYTKHFSICKYFQALKLLTDMGRFWNHTIYTCSMWQKILTNFSKVMFSRKDPMQPEKLNTNMTRAMMMIIKTGSIGNELMTERLSKNPWKHIKQYCNQPAIRLDYFYTSLLKL